MANDEIMILGIVMVMLSGITMVAPPMYDLVDTFTNWDDGKLGNVLVITFFAGIAVTLIGIKSRKQTRQITDRKTNETYKKSIPLKKPTHSKNTRPRRSAVFKTISASAEYTIPIIHFSLSPFLSNPQLTQGKFITVIIHLGHTLAFFERLNQLI